LFELTDIYNVDTINLIENDSGNKMNNTEIAVNELANFARQKAHTDSVIRLMIMLQQELREAGVKGAEKEMANLKAVISQHEEEITRKYDDAIFGLTITEE